MQIPLLTWVLALTAGTAFAHDHRDTEALADDPAADLADVYADLLESGEIVFTLTFGPVSPTDPAPYDSDVLYTLHIDGTGDLVADHEILIQFAQDENADWHTRFRGIPGTSGDVTGPVDTVLAAGDGQAFAGLRNDPAFADMTGVVEVVANGNLAFDAERDTFEGQNVLAAVVQIDQELLTDGQVPALAVWATSARR